MRNGITLSLTLSTMAHHHPSCQALPNASPMAKWVCIILSIVLFSVNEQNTFFMICPRDGEGVRANGERNFISSSETDVELSTLINICVGEVLFGFPLSNVSCVSDSNDRASNKTNVHPCVVSSGAKSETRKRRKLNCYYSNSKIVWINWFCVIHANNEKII